MAELVVSCGAACGLGKGGAWAKQAWNFCISCYLGCCVLWACLFLTLIQECFLCWVSPEQWSGIGDPTQMLEGNRGLFYPNGYHCLSL